VGADNDAAAQGGAACRRDPDITHDPDITERASGSSAREHFAKCPAAWATPWAATGICSYEESPVPAHQRHDRAGRRVTQGGLCRHPPSHRSFPISRQDRGWGGALAAGRGWYCAAGSVRLLRIFCCVCLSERLSVQMRAGSCLRVVRTDSLRGSADAHTHGDELPSASGCCARVLDGAGGRVV
jgi:hypothetical protein